MSEDILSKSETAVVWCIFVAAIAAGVVAGNFLTILVMKVLV